MTRHQILEKAIEYVTKDRQATHGHPEDNFGTIADLWDIYLTAVARRSPNFKVKLNAINVAVMMALVKVARIASTPEHIDNWVDGAGYFGCGGEMAQPKTTGDCNLATPEISPMRAQHVHKLAQILATWEKDGYVKFTEDERALITGGLMSDTYTKNHADRVSALYNETRDALLKVL